MSSERGVALVTGSAQGIGRGIALRLADDGFDIAVNDISANKPNLASLAEEIRSKGRKALEVVADVSVEDEVKGMVESAVKELGGLDVMVANAGVFVWKPIVETSVEDWDRVYSINVRGVFLCYKYAAKQMLAQGRGGRIIGASSGAGKKGQPNLTAYSSSKFAVRGLTQSAATELGKEGITVNAYAPGAIGTPMLENMNQIFTEATGGQFGQFDKILAAGCAVGHKGTPTQIASLVSYLASKEAHYITGQTINCDGGMNFD